MDEAIYKKVAVNLWAPGIITQRISTEGSHYSESIIDLNS